MPPEIIGVLIETSPLTFEMVTLYQLTTLLSTFTFFQILSSKWSFPAVERQNIKYRSSPESHSSPKQSGHLFWVYEERKGCGSGNIRLICGWPADAVALNRNLSGTISLVAQGVH